MDMTLAACLGGRAKARGPEQRESSPPPLCPPAGWGGHFHARRMSYLRAVKLGRRTVTAGQLDRRRLVLNVSGFDEVVAKDNWRQKAQTWSQLAP